MLHDNLSRSDCMRFLEFIIRYVFIVIININTRAYIMEKVQQHYNYF